ncbi:hypothetical protein FKX85_19990 [Echinicola soli]|uniref:Uncharacterized protein n=1 Tax=Echinicola soli TaxID=2591634 RepID=A0A514CMZ6_9BACT|nr:hypothetical protein [Echinicola soli]QDH81186.1 hypothetical protein FKX85_19990 [Echinicola soli]
MTQPITEPCPGTGLRKLVESVRAIPKALAGQLSRFDRQLSKYQRILLFALLFTLWAATIVLQTFREWGHAPVAVSAGMPPEAARPVMDTTVHQLNQEKP